MSVAHVVWDWNGTLLDDLHIVVAAVNGSIAGFAEGPITIDDYRDHYTRPVRDFYSSLFGRVITDEEWLRLDTSFHDHYFDLATTVELAHDARDAIEMVADNAWSQSLLSMSPDEWLQGIVERLDVVSRFERIDGLSEAGGGGLKATHLERHLSLMGISGRDTVVIGDTRDDVAAARHVGARPILFHGGSHHLDVLETEGVPVAETLVGAVELALSRP